MRSVIAGVLVFFRLSLLVNLEALSKRARVIISFYCRAKLVNDYYSVGWHKTKITNLVYSGA